MYPRRIDVFRAYCFNNIFYAIFVQRYALNIIHYNVVQIRPSKSSSDFAARLNIINFEEIQNSFRNVVLLNNNIITEHRVLLFRRRKRKVPESRTTGILRGIPRRRGTAEPSKSERTNKSHLETEPRLLCGKRIKKTGDSSMFRFFFFKR